MKETILPLKIALGVYLLSAITCLNSCMPVPTSGEDGLLGKGLLLGEPCSPPCWQGLVPGVSTQEDVDEFLRTSEYVDFDTVYKDRYEGGVAIRWQRRWQAGGWNMFNVQDGVLEVMRMCSDAEVVVEQLMDRYGPPDKLEAGLVMLDGPVHTKVDLFYRELGMMIELRLPADDPELRPETRVVTIWYFEPAELEDILATIWLKKGVSLRDLELDWLEDWHDWQGYGPVELE